jgi:drug/metabolite transporter (DMT)-like permease
VGPVVSFERGTGGNPVRGGRAGLLRGGLFLVMVISWGFNYPFVRLGLEETSPLWLALFRAAVGAAGTALYLRLAGVPSTALDRRRKFEAFLLGIPNTALFFGLWFLAASQVPPGLTSVLIYTFPLWVSLLSIPLLGEPLGPVKWGGVLLGFAGVVFVTEPWRGGMTGPSLLSLVELLGAALSWAGATVYFKRNYQGEGMRLANGYQLLGGTVVLVGGAVLLEPAGLGHPAGTLVAVVLYMGLIGTTLAYAIWFYLLQTYRATTLSTYSFLVPLAALAASAWIFHEGITLAQTLGVTMVLAGIYIEGSFTGPGPVREGSEARAEASGGGTASRDPPTTGKRM